MYVSNKVIRILVRFSDYTGFGLMCQGKQEQEKDSKSWIFAEVGDLPTAVKNNLLINDRKFAYRRRYHFH